MSQITHEADESGRLVQVVSPAQLRLQLDADGDDNSRPVHFGPDDEWKVGPAAAQPELLAFLSVQQPWASLIAHGGKTIETRTYHHPYRGPLVICASKLPQKPWPDGIARRSESYYHYGCAVCVCDMVDCRPLRQIDSQWAGFGGDLIDTAGRWAWVLKNIRPIDPVPVRGKQFLWKESIRAVNDAVARAK